ncbi:hypothetical protein RAM07_08355 [Lactobacillus helsingborgensis]|uniref:helix-turn-helix domain-containing protein n=1 Tax=Lactobacillus helsingborgensis TaxID=1218494 RepID=UPI002740F46F|nr:hypothetical protein [Lactobacillus helsingborgensis]WLT00267.1 hypothetical protein RAM07_08355 [Lactobacillus helsingborgensis]
MTIGALLRQYRLEAGKTQRAWIGDVISPSFYSKVEKDLTRISAADLIELLRQNHVEIAAFFKQLDYQAESEDNLKKKINAQMTDAYYNFDIKRLKEIKQAIAGSGLASKNELMLSVNSILAIIDGNKEKLSAAEIQQLKNKFFNEENFDWKTIKIFLNCMVFYDFASDMIITNKIFQQFKDSANDDIQFIVLGILINMISMCLEKNKYKEAKQLVEKSHEIHTRPLTCFSKMTLLFLENMINYHFDPKQIYLDNSARQIEEFSLIGMTEFSKQLQKIVQENT